MPGTRRRKAATESTALATAVLTATSSLAFAGLAVGGLASLQDSSPQPQARAVARSSLDAPRPVVLDGPVEPAWDPAAEPAAPATRSAPDSVPRTEVAPVSDTDSTRGRPGADRDPAGVEVALPADLRPSRSPHSPAPRLTAPRPSTPRPSTPHPTGSRPSVSDPGTPPASVSATPQPSSPPPSGSWQAGGQPTPQPTPRSTASGSPAPELSAAPTPSTPPTSPTSVSPTPSP